MMTILFHKKSGAAAIAETFAPNFVIKIHQIKLTLSAIGANDERLTADIDAVDGTAYDGRIINQNMTSAKTMIKGFNPPIMIDKGDEIDFAYENSGSATWGLEIAFERVS